MPHTPLDPADCPSMGTPNYTHGMVTEGVSRWLHIAGQVGVLPNGETADGALAQCHAAFDNVGRLLEGAGMTTADICDLKIYMTHREDLLDFREARAKFLGGPDKVVNSTLVFVSGLVDPDWRVELEIVAAR